MTAMNNDVITMATEAASAVVDGLKKANALGRLTMSSDHEDHDNADSRLKTAVASALDRLDRLFLANGVLQRLSREILANQGEVHGVDAAAERMARALVDKRTVAIREAIDRLSRTAAPGREQEAMAALLEFTNGAIESLKVGNLADIERRLVGFGYTINRLSAPPAAPRVPRNVNDLPDMTRRQLVAATWSVIETEFLTIELMHSGEAPASFDARGATTVGGRRITRQWLREVNAPTVPEFRAKFMAALPKIPER